MREFESFDDLTSNDPTDGALEVMGLPWRVDGQSAEILRDRHDIEIGDLLRTVQEAAGGTVDQATLDEYGIESAEDLRELSAEEQEEIADEAGSLTGTLSAAAALLHAGWVRFEPGLTREDVKGALDLPALSELPIAQMMARLTPSADDEAPASGDGDEGKS